MKLNKNVWFLMLAYLLISFITAVTLIMILSKLALHLIHYYQTGNFYFPVSELILSIKVGIIGGGVGGVGSWFLYRINLRSRK